MISASDREESKFEEEKESVIPSMLTEPEIEKHVDIELESWNQEKRNRKPRWKLKQRSKKKRLKKRKKEKRKKPKK
eukprot:CAMPEP_0170543274 /NCGR_PEP_ID=MMETSP0211-20121228/2446_1 /TAXON_ID=311385 /ORGANISM="Pseudokeronopsis sp., Strain OXSARD2" /LENGTH=75 /DNA_ID=CAMNT_0010846609 /DNA_START=2288 /DNA_END=2513 /DNA_ORIENTATION=+